MDNNGSQLIGNHSAQQRSFLYPVIWALYLIGFIVLAHCFDRSSTSLAMPSVAGSHLAAVFGIGSFDESPCTSNCQAAPAPSWTSLHVTVPTDACSNISINPDLQSGCGFSMAPSSTPSPAPETDISASAPAELPPPPNTLLSSTTTHASSLNSEGDTSMQ